MNCEQVSRQHITEKYLLGQLTEADQDAFEHHYFECARCFEEVQTFCTLQAGLREASAAIRAEALARRPRWRWSWRWAWAPGLAAVLILVAVGVWVRGSRSRVEPATSVPGAPAPKTPLAWSSPQEPLGDARGSAGPFLAELAQVEPPRYSAMTLRGPADEATQRFRRAMERYLKKDYASAIAGLRAALELEPQSAQARFFLGACYLLTEQTDPAIEAFERTIALGDSPFLEEAHFYLAKALLRKGDLAAARKKLTEAIQLKGELEAEARRLLEQLQTVR